MIRIDPVQPDPAPPAFAGTESGASPSGGGSDQAPAPDDGDTVTLSADALIALAILSAEAESDPAAPPGALLPGLPLPGMPAPGPETAPAPATPPLPAAHLPPATDTAFASTPPLGGGENVPPPANWERAYQRTLLSAPVDSRAAARIGERISTDHTGNPPPIPSDQTATDAHPDPANIPPLASLAPSTQSLPGVDERMAAMYAPPPGRREMPDHTPKTDDEDATEAERPGRTAPTPRDALAPWHRRRLDALYPVIVFTTLRVGIRDHSVIRDRTAHLALAMHLDGTLDLLGLWIGRHEGATGPGRHIMESLKRRGVEDILMAVTDGPDGLADAVRVAFPQAAIHPSLDHLPHHPPDIAALNDHEAPGEKAASAAESAWGRRLLSARRAIEALHALLGRAIHARGPFASDEAALAFLYLKARTAEKTSP
ncbi:transposase [Gluconacetobacter sacchari]|uniref:transposase n=1 Tax=Gluconacetobacter sacchari TaxID=92759 RepID=UPI0039B3D546